MADKIEVRVNDVLVYSQATDGTQPPVVVPPPTNTTRVVPPPADVRYCSNCRRWHRRDYIHCQHSGPWGGDIPNDPRCTFVKAPSQRKE